jgi:hypothetical protein
MALALRLLSVAARYTQHMQNGGLSIPSSGRADFFHSIRKVVALTGKPKEVRATKLWCLELSILAGGRGIAFDGDSGVSRLELSADGGGSWQPTVLGRDEGTYSFRQWSSQITAPHSGTLTLQVRCTNTKGEVQPSEPNWNGGFMRNAIERVRLTIA